MPRVPVPTPEQIINDPQATNRYLADLNAAYPKSAAYAANPQRFETAWTAAQKGFQEGLSAPSMPAPVYPSVGREAQFANPYGVSPEHAGAKALPGISPEHAGAKAATYQSPLQSWGGECMRWTDFHGIVIPQPGGSLKDCLFDWAIGGIAGAVIVFGVIFLIRGAK